MFIDIRWVNLPGSPIGKGNLAIDLNSHDKQLHSQKSTCSPKVVDHKTSFMVQQQIGLKYLLCV